MPQPQGEAQRAPEAVVWGRRSPNSRICSVFHTHRRNRTQTRQVWWWSFGVPTLASRHLQSAQDAGERAGMPPATHLLGFDNRNNLTRALRCLRRGGAARLRAMRHRVLEDARRASSVLSSARELQARELCIQYGIRAAALRCSHGPRPRRRGVVHGQPSGVSELRRARLGPQAKPLPGRSGHGGSYTAPQAIVLKLHEQLRTPPPPQGAWRHHFYKEKEDQRKKRALRAARAKQKEQLNKSFTFSSSTSSTRQIAGHRADSSSLLYTVYTVTVLVFGGPS